MVETRCQRDECSAELPRAGRGRPARYCSAACRQAAYRARNTLPAEMVALDRWVRRSRAKVPLTVRARPASSTNPATWSSYRVASRSRVGVGLGYVLARQDRVVCIDLDHCLVDGVLAEWARAIVARCRSTYVEVSPSGTGLHVFGRGQVPVGVKRRGPDGYAVEVYSSGRYIAVTGQRWGRAPRRLADLSSVIGEL